MKFDAARRLSGCGSTPKRRVATVLKLILAGGSMVALAACSTGASVLAGAATLSIGGAPINLSRETNGDLSLAFTYRVDQPATGPVTLAMGDGKRAAAAIDSWLNGIWPPPKVEPTVAERPARPARSATPVPSA